MKRLQLNPNAKERLEKKIEGKMLLGEAEKLIRFSDARKALYGLNEDGTPAIPHWANYSVRCEKCGKFFFFDRVKPFHPHGQLQPLICQRKNGGCGASQPFLDSTKREYAPSVCKTVEDEIRQYAASH